MLALIPSAMLIRLSTLARPSLTNHARQGHFIAMCSDRATHVGGQVRIRNRPAHLAFLKKGGPGVNVVSAGECCVRNAAEMTAVPI
jgi:hypothetical protein